MSEIDTLAMVHSGDPWAGLMDFHRAVLDQIGWVQEVEARQRWAELQLAMDGEHAMVSEFSSRLAAVANETELPVERAAGDALLAACRAIGRELGVEVRPPRKSSDQLESSEEDSLGENRRRASGLHVREVTLPHDWADRGSGEPLLAGLADEGDRPVAVGAGDGARPARESSI